ncbi:MAG: GH92 family glycosyl hydrolase [Candidatus Merdivicinus sp.]|jgi:predicted alpha-1,2-mannosidase
MSQYDEVNTLMGAVANEAGGDGGGKTYPGAVLPFGMVQLSPDTITGGDNGSGYSYAHETIEGFSMIHMSGIGWYGDFGNIQIMPITGTRRYFSGTNEYTKYCIGELSWASRYNHATEIGKPGYYAVDLSDYQIRAEATAARHTGALRFTFQTGGESHILVDLYRRIGGHSSSQDIEILDSSTIEGKILCMPEGGGWGHGKGHVKYELFFVMKFSRPMESWALWDEGNVLEGKKIHHGTSLGIAADFHTNPGEQIEVHTAISFVDMRGARNNFDQEDQSFDSLHENAKLEWEKALQCIQIEGGTRQDREVFCSSLYHVLLDPRDFSDCDGRYRIAMGKPETVHSYTFRTIFSGWDVFRSAFPLFSLIRPDVVQDEINSLIFISNANKQSPFPRWEIVGIESGCMVGDPGANILCDAYLKGIRGYDVESAYEICRSWWLGDKADQGELADFLRLGYFPNDISKTLEYSFTAWCLSRLAKALGKFNDADAFYQYSMNYRNIFDTEAGWMNCRDRDGKFIEFQSKYKGFGCVESNIYQQTWFVPHDIPGLRNLMGKDRFERELDEFFEKADFSAFWNDNYNHSNEPVHTVPHIYVEIGIPEKTQYWVRRIQKEAYRPGAYGYCGNEDVGQMSAWYVLTAMGIHQSVSASNLFETNTPLFTKAVISLNPEFHSCKNSTQLVICTDCDPERYPYIAGISVNGTKIHRTCLTWEELSDGGEIIFYLSDVPGQMQEHNLKG